MVRMNDPVKIRQALERAEAAAKIYCLLAVASAGLYLWFRRPFDLGMACAWSALFILLLLVCRIRKRKLKALDPD
jgi:hypothetical protein